MDGTIRFGFIVCLMACMVLMGLFVGLAGFAPIGSHDSDFSAPPRISYSQEEPVSVSAPKTNPQTEALEATIQSAEIIPADETIEHANAVREFLVSPDGLKLALEKEKDIDYIVSLLTHPDKAVRIETVRKINRLSHELWSEKWKSPTIWLMGALKPYMSDVAPAFLETLRQDTMDGIGYQNYSAMTALMKSRPDVLPMMAWSSENHPDEEVRKSWLRICVTMAPETSVTKNLVRTRLRDSNPEVRRYALKMLIQLSV
jgi:hypothetical protein